VEGRAWCYCFRLNNALTRPFPTGIWNSDDSVVGILSLGKVKLRSGRDTLGRWKVVVEYAQFQVYDLLEPDLS
jgi:hypothetical protein